MQNQPIIQESSTAAVGVGDMLKQAAASMGAQPQQPVVAATHAAPAVATGTAQTQPIGVAAPDISGVTRRYEEMSVAERNAAELSAAAQARLREAVALQQQADAALLERRRLEQAAGEELARAQQATMVDISNKEAAAAAARAEADLAAKKASTLKAEEARDGAPLEAARQAMAVASQRQAAAEAEMRQAQAAVAQMERKANAAQMGAQEYTQKSADQAAVATARETEIAQAKSMMGGGGMGGAMAGAALGGAALGGAAGYAASQHAGGASAGGVAGGQMAQQSAVAGGAGSGAAIMGAGAGYEAATLLYGADPSSLNFPYVLHATIESITDVAQGWNPTVGSSMGLSQRPQRHFLRFIAGPVEARTAPLPVSGALSAPIRAAIPIADPSSLVYLEMLAADNLPGMGIQHQQQTTTTTSAMGGSGIGGIGGASNAPFLGRDVAQYTTLGRCAVKVASLVDGHTSAGNVLRFDGLGGVVTASLRLTPTNVGAAGGAVAGGKGVAAPAGSGLNWSPLRGGAAGGAAAGGGYQLLMPQSTQQQPYGGSLAQQQQLPSNAISSMAMQQQPFAQQQQQPF